jgi:hypothetical protein
MRLAASAVMQRKTPTALAGRGFLFRAVLDRTPVAQSLRLLA